MYKQVLVVFAAVVIIRAELLSEIFGDCEENVECAEGKFVKELDVLDAEPNVSVIGDALVLKKVKTVVAQSRSHEGVVERVTRFLSEHEMKIKLPRSLTAAGALISEARSSKLKKFIIPFVVLMILKKSIEVPIFLAVVSLIAFKGLGAGLISLVLSGATAFKSLLEHHTSSKVSYEVVPQIAPSHWSRSGVDYPNLTAGGYHTITDF